MPRDDLTINGHFRNMPPGLGTEHLDAMAVLEDFTSRASNLPAEIQFMQEEVAHKEQEMQGYMEFIHTRDAQLQKFVRLNGSLTPNPKDPLFQKAISDHFDKAQLLQEEKCALAVKTQQTLDRQIRYLDIQLKLLQDRGEFPADPELPSLLRPPPEPVASRANQAPNGVAQAPQTAPLPTHATPQPINAQQRMATAQTQAPHGTAGVSASAPATPAAPLLLQRRGSRETSAGAANKRQRISGGVGNVPQPSSGLARHTSTGPGTPKAGTPTSSRAGSAGPRGSQKSVTTGKKIAPHKQGAVAAQKARLGKSGLSRVRRSGTKNSPSSTNDSELSDAESTSMIDEDELATSPPIKKLPGDEGGDGEEDEGSDDKKYCICQKVSFGDMVACDNDDCPYEWFHWPCVGLKSEPAGTWICPICSRNQNVKR